MEENVLAMDANQAMKDNSKLIFDIVDFKEKLF